MATKNAANAYVSLQTLSVLFPSEAHKSNETLPFVTIQDFEAFGEGIREVSKATLIAFTPLLQTQNAMKAWNAYSANNTDWIAQGRAFNPLLSAIHDAVDDSARLRVVSFPTNKTKVEEGQKHHSTSTNSNADRRLLDDTINFVYTTESTGKVEPEGGDGPFTPIWQMTPVPRDTKIINYNLAANRVYAELFLYADTTGQPILSEPLDSQEFFVSTASDKESPASVLVYPVFDEFEHVAEHKTVGFISGLFHWEQFFEDVRPNSNHRIVGGTADLTHHASPFAGPHRRST